MGMDDEADSAASWNIPGATNWDDDNAEMTGKVGNTTQYTTPNGPGSVTTPKNGR